MNCQDTRDSLGNNAVDQFYFFFSNEEIAFNLSFFFTSLVLCSYLVSPLLTLNFRRLFTSTTDSTIVSLSKGLPPPPSFPLLAAFYSCQEKANFEMHQRHTCTLIRSLMHFILRVENQNPLAQMAREMTALMRM